jgi:hypothetical protein
MFSGNGSSVSGIMPEARRRLDTGHRIVSMHVTEIAEPGGAEEAARS